MDCDESIYKESPQVQATFSIWKKNADSIDFVQKWLKYGQDRRIITDDENTCGLPNDPQFIRHRWDQSILTNLVIKEGLIPFSYSIEMNRLIDKNLSRLIRIVKTPPILLKLELAARRIKNKIIS